ncbi:MAG: ATP-binding cassette domain-containing protein [Verrucomicrobiota bacterium]|nr:ATP-binding cassette domain-containing protein [Verrucomicrobiota bacterium]
MIRVENLHKWYGSIQAVDDVSFSVDKGEVLGFIGPNGAGKSTTMRMITGFIAPSRGKVLIDGIDMAENPIAAKSKIGYLPENAPSYSSMTTFTFLKFAAEMRGFSGKERDKKVDEIVETCFLEPVLYQSVETLSKGYTHRVCFAQSIIHDPEILILDEPTDGLDPNQKYEVRTLIKNMGEKKAIILSTHILEEVDAVCSRLMTIDRGKIVADGTPDSFRKRSETAGTVLLTINGESSNSILENLEKLNDVEKTFVVSEEDSDISVRIYPKNKADSDKFSSDIFNLVKEEKMNLVGLQIEKGRLEDVFRSITLEDREEVKA